MTLEQYLETQPKNRRLVIQAAWEAARRDALEEAIKVICYHCRMGIPVKPLSESLVLWHRDLNSGRLDICQAAAIRALQEKGE